METRWDDELYSLENDRCEPNNPATLHPEDVDRLRAVPPKTHASGDEQVIGEETHRQL
jgi:hypothetical protein